MALEDKIEKLSTRVGKAINDLLPDTWYQRSDLPLAQKTSIQIYKTSVMINGKVYKNTTATTLALNSASSWDDSTYATASKRAGKDVRIYACAPASGTAPVFKLSINNSAPTGYSTQTSRQIGGFHCLCNAVGTIADHTLSGYAQGDILPASVWDLRHHAVSEYGSDGMVYCNGLWVDIYLAGWNGSELVSAWMAPIACGSTFGTNPALPDEGCSGESFAEEAAKVGKRLVTRDYFMAIAEGSNQRTNISVNSNPYRTGGYKDTKNIRMISNCGCEDCCGVCWQFTADLFDSGALVYDSLNGKLIQQLDTYETSNKKFNTRVADAREESVWEDTRTTLDTVPNTYNTSGRGSGVDTWLRRLLVGGSYSDGTVCGTRAVYATVFSSARNVAFGARLCAESYES